MADHTISIITATYNSAETIRDCLLSIRQQTVAAEHIVIDGLSTDATASLVKESAGNKTHLVSEADNGIYDAMNKGIILAQGDVVGILNSDDFYPSDDILSTVLDTFKDPSIEACYGDLLYVDGLDTAKVIRNWHSGVFDHRKFYWGWMPPHPTFFVRRSVYQKYGMFNTELGSSADYEIMLRFLVKHKINASYIPKVLVKMRTGGISNASLRNRIEANRMDRKAWEINGLTPYPWTLWMKPVRKIGQWFFK